MRTTVLMLGVLLISNAACSNQERSTAAQGEKPVAAQGEEIPAEKASPSPGGPTTSPPRPPSPWRIARPGLHHRYWSPAAGVRIEVFRIDPRDWELRASVPTKRQTAAQLLTSGAALVVNGGFFDREQRSMGLRVSGGVTLNPWREADWGVFSVGMDGRPRQIHARDWALERVPPGPEFAIEAGPRLVVDGVALGLKPSLARRTVIAADFRGRILLLVTRDAVELGELARSLARPAAAGGLGVRHALNLDGGPSTQLATQARLFPDLAPIHGGWPVPDAIEVHRRPQ